MPSTSKKQHNFMAAVANSPAFAKKAGVPKSVGKEFVAADKSIKFGKAKPSRASLQKINKPDTRQGKSELFAKGGDMKESKAMVKKEISFMKAKKAPPAMIKHEKAEATAMKKGGCAKMADGGMTMVKKGGKMIPDFAADGKGKMAKGGCVKKMANGGFTRAADGIAKQGRTQATQITMKRGGKC